MNVDLLRIDKNNNFRLTGIVPAMKVNSAFSGHFDMEL